MKHLTELGRVASSVYWRTINRGQGSTAYSVAKELGISRSKAARLLTELEYHGLLNQSVSLHRAASGKNGNVWKRLYTVNLSGEKFLEALGWNTCVRLPF